eukprot:Hpha_TRINITY_DN16633_c0_g5::TRINITY_DN16633_c0_g5_i2::g.179499::m.179499
MEERKEHVSIKRRLYLFMVYVLTTIAYILIGAAVMVMIEAPEEDMLMEQVRNMTVRLLQCSNLTLDNTEDLLDIGHVAGHAHGSLKNAGVWHNHWSFSGSCFYCLTVITTVGYGSFAPRTLAGRCFTGLYAFFGISIIGQLLVACAHLLKESIKGIAQRIRKRLKRPGAFVEPSQGVLHFKKDEWERCLDELRFESGVLPTFRLPRFFRMLSSRAETPHRVIVDNIIDLVDPDDTGVLDASQQLRAVALWYTLQEAVPHRVTRTEACVSIGSCTLWMCMWASIFAGIEGWTFSEGLWFSFVTMSTIGFGDFTPATNLGRFLGFIFLVPGLGLGAAALSVLWEYFAERRFWFLQRKHTQGKVSLKLLEAHGITCRLKVQRVSAAREDLANSTNYKLHRSLSSTVRMDNSTVAAADALGSSELAKFSGSPMSPVQTKSAFAASGSARASLQDNARPKAARRKDDNGPVSEAALYPLTPLAPLAPAPSPAGRRSRVLARVHSGALQGGLVDPPKRLPSVLQPADLAFAKADHPKGRRRSNSGTVGRRHDGIKRQRSDFSNTAGHTPAHLPTIGKERETSPTESSRSKGNTPPEQQSPQRYARGSLQMPPSAGQKSSRVHQMTRRTMSHEALEFDKQSGRPSPGPEVSSPPLRRSVRKKATSVVDSRTYSDIPKMPFPSEFQLLKQGSVDKVKSERRTSTPRSTS